MVLSPLLLNSLLPICLRNLTCVTLTRTFVRNRYTRTLPPTILKTILGRDKGKSFGKDATSDSGVQRAINFVSPCLREELLCKMSDPVRDSAHKVTIVGAGMVGVAIANSLLFQVVYSFKFFMDKSFILIMSSSIMSIHKNLINYKCDFFLIMDIMSSSIIFIQKNLINYKCVLGSGTYLDSARFRYMIADRLEIAPSSVQAYIIGEHGNSMVPLWSGVSVAGVQFRDIIPNIGLETDDEKWFEISNYVIKLGATVRCLKGYTNTAIGLSAANIITAILRNSQTIIPVSTLVQGHHDVCHDMFLSLPCTIGENGITQIIRMHITEEEKKLFQSSAETVHKVQKDLKIK
ncbi:LDHA dehydrogenase, partial [Pseudoatta argentina]